MIQIIEFLTKILDLILGYSIKKDQERQDEQYKKIARNPRDLFDDGVLNGSDSEANTSGSVPKDHS